MWEQTPFEQMPRPLCMGWSRLATLSVLAALMALLAGTSITQADEIGQDEHQGAMFDVRLVPASCLLGGECNITQPTHLVEYYGADWCEPCEPVAEELSNLSSEQAFVLQHHASPADETFLSASKLRYDHEFRLVFIPSLVVDGVDLLTGTRQAMDLQSVLNTSAPFPGGLETLTINGTVLSWNLSSNATVRAWYVEPTPHESKEQIHSTLARAMVEVNATDGSLDAGAFNLNQSGSLVVMLEQPGVRSLNVASLAPTGPMSLSEGDLGASGQGSTGANGWWAFTATVGLLALALPALLMHRNLMKQKRTPPPLESKENE